LLIHKTMYILISVEELVLFTYTGEKK